MKRTVIKRWFKPACLLLAAALMCTGWGCGSDVPKLLEPVGSGDNLVQAVRGEMYNTIVSDTTLVPTIQYVRLDGQGIVAGLPVALGDQVKKGDVLVELDGQQLSDQISSLDQQIADLTADNQYVNQWSQLEIQIGQLEIAQMQASGAGADEIAEKTEEITKQQDQLYTNQVEQEKELAQLQLQKMEGGVSGTPLLSPCDGTVIALRAGNIGDVIENQVVAVIAQTDSKELRGDYIEESVLNEAHESYALINGKRYEITLSPYSDNELNWLGIMGGIPHNTYYLNEEDSAVYGDRAVIVIITDYREDVLYIPDNALYSDVDSYYVYVQNKDGKRERRDMEIGFVWDSAVEITGGLQEGEVLYAK